MTTKQNTLKPVERLSRVRVYPGPFIAVSLINTSLQRGSWREGGTKNRFNGFGELGKTVETVSDAVRSFDTLLKQGVNEKLLAGEVFEHTFVFSP